MQKPLHQLSQNPRYSALMAAARAMRNWPPLADYPERAPRGPEVQRDPHGSPLHRHASRGAGPLTDAR